MEKGDSRNIPSFKQSNPKVGDALFDEILIETEHNGENTSQHQSDDHRRRTPALGDSTPLSSENEANSETHRKDDTNPVTHEQLLEHSFGVAFVRIGTTKRGSTGLEEN